jgi:hypothetical protein
VKKKTTLGHVALRFSSWGRTNQVPSGAWPASSTLQSKRQVALWLGHCQAWPMASLGSSKVGPEIALGAGRGQTKRHMAFEQHHPRPAAQRHLALGCFLLSAAQAPCGALTAYTFSIITSISIKNIIIV